MDALLRLPYVQSTGVLTGLFKALPGNLMLKRLSGVIYIYETLSSKGCGKVVGYLEPGETIDVRGKFIESYFIEDYCRLVEKDDDMADAFAKAINTPLKNYKDGAILDFALDDEAMKHIEKYGTWPPMTFSDEEKDARRKAKQVFFDLDNFLERHGILNDGVGPGCITTIKNAVILPKALEIGEFRTVKGQRLITPPYKIRYVMK